MISTGWWFLPLKYRLVSQTNIPKIVKNEACLKLPAITHRGNMCVTVGVCRYDRWIFCQGFPHSSIDLDFKVSARNLKKWEIILVQQHICNIFALLDAQTMDHGDSSGSSSFTSELSSYHRSWPTARIAMRVWSRCLCAPNITQCRLHCPHLTTDLPSKITVSLLVVPSSCTQVILNRWWQLGSA